MQPITIQVHVPMSVALARGESTYGDADVPLSDADVASLSDAARAVLPELRSRLTADRADGPGACAAVEAFAQARAEEEAKRMADAEDRLVRAVAAGDEEWVQRGDRYYLTDGGDGYAVDTGRRHLQPVVRPPVWANLDETQEADPRVVARREQVERGAYSEALATWERRYAEWEAWLDRRREENAARDAARAEAKAVALEACSVGLRELASQEEDLSRAARDGYAIDNAMLDRLAHRLGKSAKAEHYIVYRYPDALVEERPAPRPNAFALLDAVTAVAKEENARIPATVGQWQVSRVVRTNVCTHGNRRHYVTAVTATLTTPAGLRIVLMSSEPLQCAHRNEDADY